MVNLCLSEEKGTVIKIATAVVLAGGMSRRMGRDKLVLAIGGTTMLESAVNRFSAVFEDVYISVADDKKYPDVDTLKIVDILPGAGPISGLHAALTVLTCDGLFLVAADLPYACPKAAKRIIELAGDSEACVVRLPDGNIEPLFGYYRKSLLCLCANAIESGNHKMADLLSLADTRYIAPAELGGLWDDKFIMNVNSPEDYSRLL